MIHYIKHVLQLYLPKSIINGHHLLFWLQWCRFKKYYIWELPNGLVVRILGFHCPGLGSVPGWGTEIPNVVQPKLKFK